MKIYKYQNIKKHFILDVLMKLNEQTDSESKLDFAVSVSDATQKKPKKIYDFPLSVLSSREIKNIIILMFSVRVVLFQ